MKNRLIKRNPFMLLAVGFLTSLFVIQVFGKENVSEYQGGGDYYEVRIITGGGAYGEYSLNLLREGLLCKTLIRKSDNSLEDTIVFIPFSELNINDLEKLQQHVNNNFKTLIQKQNTAGKVYNFHRYIKILINKNANGVHEKMYLICNEETDNLLNMMNKLIPKKHRESFGIKSKCD